MATGSGTRTFRATQSQAAPWRDGTGVPAPTAGAAHVWRVPLTATTKAVAAAGRLLGDEVRARVRCLVGLPLKNRRSLSYGLLRLVIARYLDMAPEDILFARSKTGKPRLDGCAAASGLRFNVAHSGELALFGFATQGEIGVDVECRRTPDDLDGLLSTVLTPAECVFVRRLPVSARARVFLDAWTLKEACLKATGEGIAGLQRVEAVLGVAGGEPLLGIRLAAADAPAAWSVRRLVPSAGHSAAAIVTAPGITFSHFSLDPETWLA